MCTQKSIPKWESFDISALIAGNMILISIASCYVTDLIRGETMGYISESSIIRIESTPNEMMRLLR
jgi:ABC-type arginine transport system permease subunit